jgi:hypothetical protein
MAIRPQIIALYTLSAGSVASAPSSGMIVAPPFFQVGQPIPVLGKARQAARLIGVFFDLGLAGSFRRPLPELGFVRHIHHIHFA